MCPILYRRKSSPLPPLLPPITLFSPTRPRTWHSSPSRRCPDQSKASGRRGGEFPPHRYGSPQPELEIFFCVRNLRHNFKNISADTINNDALFHFRGKYPCTAVLNAVINIDPSLSIHRTFASCSAPHRLIFFGNFFQIFHRHMLSQPYAVHRPIKYIAICQNGMPLIRTDQGPIPLC